MRSKTQFGEQCPRARKFISTASCLILLVACSSSPDIAGERGSPGNSTTPPAAKTEPLTVLGHEYRQRAVPPITSGGVVEVAANQCYIHRTKGGTLELYFKNLNSVDVTIEDIQLNGLSLDAYIDLVSTDDTFRDVCNPIQPLSWWSLDSKTLPPNGVATVVINGDVLLPNVPQTFNVITSPSDASVTSQTFSLATTASTITDLFFNEEEQRSHLFLAPANGEHIEGVKVNGNAINWRGGSTLNSGSPTLLELDTTLTLGEPFIVQVDIENSPPIMTQRRVVDDRFSNGMGITEVDKDDLNLLHDTQFNSVTAFNHSPQADYENLDLVISHAEENNMGVMLYGAHSAEERLEIFRHYHDRPGVWALEPIDEPDLVAAPGLPYGIHFSTPMEVQALINEANKINATKPAAINLQFIGAINMFGAQGDINGWDHYPFTSDVINLRFEGAADYADTFRTVRGAKPFWFWPPVYSDLGLINGGYDPNLNPRYPSPDDARAYSWLSFGHGAKGVRWFIYGKNSINSPTWPDVEFQTALLSHIGRDILKSTVWEQGASSSSATTDISTLVSPDSAILTLVNLQYDNHTDPTIWIEQQGVEVQWNMPPWLVGKDLAVGHIQGETITQVGTVDDAITLTTDLYSADMFVALPQERLDALIAAMTDFRER